MKQSKKPVLEQSRFFLSAKNDNMITNFPIVALFYKVKTVRKDLAFCHPNLVVETRYGEVIIILPEIESRTYLLVVVTAVAE